MPNEIGYKRGALVVIALVVSRLSKSPIVCMQGADLSANIAIYSLKCTKCAGFILKVNTDHSVLYFPQFHYHLASILQEFAGMSVSVVQPHSDQSNRKDVFESTLFTSLQPISN